MKMKMRFDSSRHLRGVSAVSIIVISVVFAGCNERMARMEENQLKLQQMVQENTEQLIWNMEQIGENRSRMYAALEQMQADFEKRANSRADFEKEQLKLQQTLQENTQQSLRDLTTVEQNQRGLHNKIEDVKTNTEKIAAATGVFEQNMLDLQTRLEGSTQDLTTLIEAAGQRQVKFEEKIQTNIQMITDTLNAVKQKQDKLQDQIADVKNNTEVMRSNMITTLEQLKAALAQIRSQISPEVPVKKESSAIKLKK